MFNYQVGDYEDTIIITHEEEYTLEEFQDMVANCNEYWAHMIVDKLCDLYGFKHLKITSWYI